MSSFISLKVIVAGGQAVAVRQDTDRVQGTRRSVIALIKPQFEAGRQQVGRGKGVIRDPLIHRQVLLEVLDLRSRARISGARVDPFTPDRAQGERGIPGLAGIYGRAGSLDRRVGRCGSSCVAVE